MITATAPKTTLSSAQLNKLHSQAEDLEGVFLNTLVKQMFSSIKTDQKSFGGGFAEETWRGMQAEQYANSMAKSGGVGLAEQLMPSLIALQEAAQNPINNPTASQGVYKK